MEACRPLRMVEAIAERLIPPACREPVLGDLRERGGARPSRFPAWQYALDVLRTVPFVVVSQMVRTTTPRLLVAEAAALSWAFLVAGRQFGSRAAFEPDTLLSGLAVPVLAALGALVVRDAYADPRRRTRESASLDAWIGAAADRTRVMGNSHGA